ncbi:iron-sulfur cluster insertion protein ErpA [Pseudochelatococcus contaminans]|uniref:Iron-sulfur cluster assembly accessory protein n=1 Tax=Pseudochelatococcus contaminans TaxID=1538103 RepID=A0A7W5Z2C9_9HYPH|nr:iron-sulfur cluster insertion protein ErpA [Pseudochelatococcus contaminans]MBB3808426.1 iron-sulfur cluster assembly accessory protein [Pseudochelatococcus contaminans]
MTVANEIADSTVLTLTDSAARRIKRVLAKEPEGAMLRVSVEGGGCSGFQYLFDVTRSRNDDDLVIEKDGAVVLVDSISLPYMEGSVLDFVDDLIGQSFKISNPHASASCGCGTSFSI